jgi:L-amino acid N-acyltransferase YncA
MITRPATISDAQAIAGIYAPIVSETSISFELEPPSADEMGRRIRDTISTYPWLVSVDETGAVDGYAYATRHRDRAAYRWSVDTSAYVREDSRGLGVGKRLYVDLIRELVRLGYCEAFAGIALPNAGSVALHGSLGFQPIAVYRRVGFKHDAWHDVSWWQKSLQTIDRPSPPITFSAHDE